MGFERPVMVLASAQLFVWAGEKELAGVLCVLCAALACWGLVPRRGP